VLDRCQALGATVVDTAYGYAGGASHRFIGGWLAADAARRSRVAVVDKVGMVETSDGLASDLSPASVARCAAAGRERMGLQQVDVVMTHAPDARTPVRRTLSALAGLIERGHARYWGVSNVDVEGLHDWLDAARALGVPGPLLVENGLSLLERADLDDVLPLCRQHGVGYLAYSPLAGGVLTGKYRRGQQPPEGSRLALRPDAASDLTEEADRLVVRLAELAASLGVSLAGLALAWVLAQPGVRPVVGASKPSHLDALSEALGLRLTSEQAGALLLDPT
jgi:aryl-alcohol dehydrogenase-like predicted oxidoreductase